MTVVVNGAERHMRESATVADVVAALDIAADARGIAVACNGSVVLRSQWHETALHTGDRIEVLHAVQGG
jgi:sulfur carrier protein